jgi:archaellum biogenesis protein FlaJ (TadC family)
MASHHGNRFGHAGIHVNYTRIALASLGAMVAYFVYGFAMFAAWPSMKTEFLKYPNVYRPKEEMMKVMPYGMIAIFIAIVVVAILYAKISPAGGGIVSGLYLGALIGVFSVCSFVIHNYINLQIGITLTIYQSFAYFIQWIVVGAAIGLIYRPS